MRAGERGFTLVWCLAAVAAAGVGLAALGPLWETAMQREREQELLRIGHLYAQAIASYKQASPGTRKEYPTSLQDLLLDTRHLSTRRHLRTLYTDPMRPGQPLSALTDAQGRIYGVRSDSTAKPLLRFAASAELEIPATGAQRYGDWTFIAQETP